MIPLVNALIALGMLGIVPLGLTLLDGGARLRVPWLAGAVPGAVSLWPPVGPAATALAACYALSTLVLAAYGIRRFARGRRFTAIEGAVLTACVTPTVAALALVSERVGVDLFGYDPAMLRLTVAHFHFAGFAAALIAGLAGRAAADPVLGRAAALSVPAGTLAVLGGYFVGQWAEFAGAVLLTVGMWLTAWLCGRRGTLLLRLSAVAVAVAMLPALWYALGEASGIPHPGLAWMAATHGVLNATGFALCGLMGLRALREETL